MNEHQKFCDFLNKIGFGYLKVIDPINSDIYCVERIDQKWGAMKLGDTEAVIPFGKYAHLFGFDGNYCLVNREGRSGKTHRDRGIIDSNGIEIVAPYTYDNIWCFYGKHVPIKIEHKKQIKYLDRKTLELIE